MAGAVERLLVDLDVLIPGFVSDFDGSVSYAASDTPKTYGVVDEVARRALLTWRPRDGRQAGGAAAAVAAGRNSALPFGVARDGPAASRKGG
jgi:hypothetical protein